MAFFWLLTGKRKLRGKDEVTSTPSIQYTQHRSDSAENCSSLLLGWPNSTGIEKVKQEKETETFRATHKFLDSLQSPATPHATGKMGNCLYSSAPFSHVTIQPYAMMLGRWQSPSLAILNYRSRGRGIRTQGQVSQGGGDTNTGHWDQEGKAGWTGPREPIPLSAKEEKAHQWTLGLVLSLGKGWKPIIADSRCLKLLFWPQWLWKYLECLFYRQRHLYLFKRWSMKPLWWNSCCFIDWTQNSHQELVMGSCTRRGVDPDSSSGRSFPNSVTLDKCLNPPEHPFLRSSEGCFEVWM